MLTTSYRHTNHTDTKLIQTYNSHRHKYYTNLNVIQKHNIDLTLIQT